MTSPDYTTPTWLNVPDEELSAMAFMYRAGLTTSVTLQQVIDLLTEVRQLRQRLEEADAHAR